MIFSSSFWIRIIKIYLVLDDILALEMGLDVLDQLVVKRFGTELSQQIVLAPVA
jgi:hypothetical protein